LEAVGDATDPTGGVRMSGNAGQVSLPTAEEIQKGIRPVTVGLQELKGFIEAKCEKKRRSDGDAEAFKSMVWKVREAVMNLIATFHDVSTIPEYRHRM
jgi:hypothetical protein